MQKVQRRTSPDLGLQNNRPCQIESFQVVWEMGVRFLEGSKGKPVLAKSED